MPRNMKREESERRTKARRQFALNHIDLRQEPTPRAAPAGATSHAVKVMDPASADAIAAYLASRGDKGGQ